MWMTIATALTAWIAVLHGYFMWLEMCGWTRPAGRRAFGLTVEFAEQTRRLAANQGLYNGFLAAGLAWSLWPGSPAELPWFFLACVLVAGVYGGYSVSRKIFWIQGAPAALALVALALARA